MKFLRIINNSDLFRYRKETGINQIIGVYDEYNFYYLHEGTIEKISQLEASNLSNMNYDEFIIFIKDLLGIKEKPIVVEESKEKKK